MSHLLSLKEEHEIGNLSKWLNAHHVTLKLPNQVYYKRKQVGTLNLVAGKQLFVPSITWEEWEAIDKRYPSLKEDLGI